MINEFSEYIFEINLLEFLFEPKNNYINDLLSLSIINNILTNNYKEIESLANKISKENNNSYIKNKISLYVQNVNNLYHSSKNIFYINKIYKNFFDKNTYLNNDINSILNYNNNFDKKFSNYHLIMIYKKIIINYITNNYRNIDESINFLKLILQKKINLYKNSTGNAQKEKSSEGGDESLKENQDNLNIGHNKLLFNIYNLNYILHINLQKFLIKQISKSLLKYVDEIINAKANNTNKNSIEKAKLDILSKLMSTSMILIQCEESWEIKYLGINLLNKLIIKFSNIKDIRGDDDSLLIQQYEVQISSCIKNIFISKSKSPVTFKSISKGFNLIYLFLTISISNDIEFITKFNEYIHFLDFLGDNKNNTIKIGNNNFNYCSEKEENIINSKFFILLCKLFISSFTKSNFNINYIYNRNEEKKIEFYSNNMADEIKNNLKEKFKENIKNFCENLKKIMYKMYQNILNKNEDKTIININLEYSNKYLLKYSSVFLTTISILLHNKELKNYENIFDNEFIEFLCKFIFYLIKQINIFKNSKNAIFYIIDIFAALINNKIFKIHYDLYLLCLNEFNELIRINEFKDNKNFILFLQKFNDNILNDENNFSNENNILLFKKESELIKVIKNNYSSNFNSVFIIIYNSIISKIIKLYNKENKELSFAEEFKYYSKFLFDIYYNNNDNNISKLILEKTFTILLSINIDKNELFKIYIELLVNQLFKLNDNFQKFFTLFYIIIQYISKSSNLELIKEIKNYYIRQAINPNNKLFDVSNKSILLSVTQMNNPNLIQFINEYLEALFNSEEKNINNFGQEIQKLIILYIQNEKNEKLRQNVIKYIIKYLNNNKEIMPIKNACTFVLGISKINNNDNKLINDEDVKNLYNEEFKNQINELIGNNSKETKNEENKNENSKENGNEEDGEDEDFDEVEG